MKITCGKISQPCKLFVGLAAFVLCCAAAQAQPQQPRGPVGRPPPMAAPHGPQQMAVPHGPPPSQPHGPPSGQPHGAPFRAERKGTLARDAARCATKFSAQRPALDADDPGAAQPHASTGEYATADYYARRRRSSSRLGSSAESTGACSV